jgi:hypothetical protein
MIRMKEKLANELSNLNINLCDNILNPEFSDYVLKFGEKILGYGWKSKNKNEKVGFMGWAAPAFDNCIWRVDNTPENLNFNEVINLFQFAISEDFLWFSLPTNNILIGYSSDPYEDAREFISNLKLFIENEFDPKIFLNKQ